MTLQQLLTDLAHDIAERGTSPHRHTLDALANAVRAEHPGAAAALTDWDGTEAARVRAFAIVHQAIRVALEAGVLAPSVRSRAEVALAA